MTDVHNYNYLTNTTKVITAGEMIRYLQREDPETPVLVLWGEGLAIDVIDVGFVRAGAVDGNKNAPGSFNAYLLKIAPVKPT